MTVGSANHMKLYEHIYMMRLANRSALRVRYNTATQRSAASKKDALHTTTQDAPSRGQSHLENTHNHRLRVTAESAVRLNQAQSSQCSSVRPRSIFLTGKRKRTLLCHVRDNKGNTTFLYNFTTKEIPNFFILNYISREPTYSLRSWGAQGHLYSSGYLLSKSCAPSRACFSACRFQYYATISGAFTTSQELCSIP
jgi:hypothetical protein